MVFLVGPYSLLLELLPFAPLLAIVSALLLVLHDENIVGGVTREACAINVFAVIVVLAVMLRKIETVPAPALLALVVVPSIVPVPALLALVVIPVPALTSLVVIPVPALTALAIAAPLGAAVVLGAVALQDKDRVRSKNGTTEEEVGLQT